MGFTEVLTIVFIVLKLIGTINWSWWLVLLPELIAVAIYIAVAVLSFAATYRAEKEIKKLIRFK